jgi:long-chain acyl-CoA synthetase
MAVDPARAVLEPGSLEYWSATTPDAVAVVNGDRTMTYAEWNESSNRVAAGLAALGLARGDRMGMRFRLDLPWFVIHRALQKLGVDQVAVNWRLTVSETAYILQDSGASGLACDDVDPTHWVGQEIGRLLTVRQPHGHWLRYEDLATQSEPTPRFTDPRTQLVIYTSGTTGRPKGVRRDRTATTDVDRLQRYLQSIRSVPPIPPKCVTLLTMPVHHGGGADKAFATCRAGGTAVCLDPYRPEEALRLIERHRVQVWTAVPTMLQRVRALGDDVVDRYDLSSLRVVSTGAAPIAQPLKEWLVARLGPDVLWEVYGLTEAGMIAYCAPHDQLRKPGSCGRPFEGVEVAIVDDGWNHLPVGTTGEIAVNTPLVLSGYLGRERLGDDAVRDGFYRTGDVGHLDEDGYVYITDRARDMIVAGGVNIYPAEIEQEILRHPDVANCAVIGIPHDDFGEAILAFVVRRSGTVLGTDELLAFLDGRLARYKQPRRFEFVDDLPISTVGKVLKRELRLPYWQGAVRSV